MYQKRITHGISAFLFLLASVLLILASFCLVGRAFYELYTYVIIRGEVSKDLLDAISFAIIAIAVYDVGRYLMEEEVQRVKELRSTEEVRRTLSRFMVVISIALALEGMVGIFEAGNQQVETVLFPVSIVFCSVSVMVGLGIYLRLTRITDAETVKDEPRTTDQSSNGTH